MQEGVNKLLYHKTSPLTVSIEHGKDCWFGKASVPYYFCRVPARCMLTYPASQGLHIGGKKLWEREQTTKNKNKINKNDTICWNPRSQGFLPSHTDWAVKSPVWRKKRPGVEDEFTGSLFLHKQQIRLLGTNLVG